MESIHSHVEIEDQINYYFSIKTRAYCFVSMVSYLLKEWIRNSFWNIKQISKSGGKT